jgi:hypothetical protein
MMLEKVKEIIRHNQGLAVAIIVIIAVGIWMFGCESKVQSPFNPNVRVSRVELQAEWELYAKKVDLAVQDLDKQDLFKQKLTEIGIAFAQGSTIDPIGAGITLLGVLGVGVIVDNKKKDSVIKGKDNEIEALKNGQA